MTQATGSNGASAAYWILMLLAFVVGYVYEFEASIPVWVGALICAVIDDAVRRLK